MSGQLRLCNVSVNLQSQRIVDDVSFSLSSGTIGCLLGPSGCGKTILLRAIAGFEQPEHGEIHLNDRLISDRKQVVAPEQRRIGMVFQDLALFPHLDVFENVAFGIRNKPEASRIARTSELLELVGMKSHSKNFPHELSGGQQQRIALIRAMAPRPDILLLDEPFSSQDIDLREQLAREVRDILHHDHITSLLITHDQFEAFAFADQIGVMSQGKLRQWDSAFNLYHRPADRIVADFIGQGVFVKGKVMAGNQVQTELGILSGEMVRPCPAGTTVELLVRPDDVVHDDDSPNHATVTEKSFRGAEHLYTLQLQGKTRILCAAPSHHDHKIGEQFGIRLEMDHLVMYPIASENMPPGASAGF